jgi:hypothetical protein
VKNGPLKFPAIGEVKISMPKNLRSNAIRRYTIRCRSERDANDYARKLRLGLLILLLGIAASMPDDASAQNHTVPFYNVSGSNTAYLGRLIGYGVDGALSNAPASAQALGAGGDKLWGTDIGLPVRITRNSEERTYFLFGDTDLLDPGAAAGQVLKQEECLTCALSPFVLANGINQGDAVGYSIDSNPDDGLQMNKVLRNVEDTGAPVCGELENDDIRALVVDGIHNNTNYYYEADPAITGFCNGLSLNTTPTGGFAVNNTLYTVTGVQNSFRDETKSDQSFLSFSDDGGLTWTLMNNGQPISGTTGGPGGKFIHIEAVPVDAADYQDPALSAPCPLPTPPQGNSKALLFYGVGTWLSTGAYLGVVFESDLESAKASPTTPLKIYYYAGETSCWVADNQAAAIPILDGTAGVHYAYFESPCGNRTVEGLAGFDYLSVTRLQGTIQGETVDRFLMVTNPGYGTCVAANADCCGGAVLAGQTHVCDPASNGFDPALLQDSGLGPVLLTGDPLKPWEWATRNDGSLRFAPIQQEPNFADGPGPNCRENVPYTHLLGGYAPLFLDHLTRVNASGDGFDVYLVTSNGRDEYAVDFYKTTVRQEPVAVPVPALGLAAQIALILALGPVALRMRNRLRAH